MTKECGSCSLCCKLLPVVSLAKPIDVWCQHCRPGAGGCTIYADRPEDCATFQCEWLRSGMSDKWKPSIAKMVLYTSKADETGQLLFMNIAVDPGTPKRWREKSYYIQIKRMALVGLHAPQKFLIRILVGKRQWVSLPNKDVELIADADFKVVQIVPGQWDIIQGDTNA